MTLGNGLCNKPGQLASAGLLLGLLSGCGGGSGGQTSNQPPSIGGRPASAITAGSAYSFTPSAADADGDTLTFSITNRPAWANFSPQSGALTGTPQPGDAGTYTDIALSVSDGIASASLPVFMIEVTAAAPLPLAVDAGVDQTIALPDGLSLDARVTENALPPQGTVSYDWSQLSGPGLVNFTDARVEDTSATITAPGSYVLSLTADNLSHTASDSVEVTVNLKAAGTSGLNSRPANTTQCVAPATPTDPSGITLQLPFPNLPALTRPVAMFMAPGDSGQWYLVQQPGQVVRFDNRPTASLVSSFIDISDRVDGGAAGGDERGLLGMAFHPDFAANGFVYLSYTANEGVLHSRVSRFNLDATGQVLDPASELIVLRVDQPFSNHNGGQISFGPDGYLYIGLGDGGSGGDPLNHGQDPNTLLGAMLRIDVGDGSSAGYRIPPDNPFVSGGGAPEIFAYGLRNPWRWSFDRATGDLWLGDVGQGEFEEVDRIVKGGNYGWNIMEGSHCYNAASCDQSGLILPVTDYSHSAGGPAVTGGYVYRGSAVPFLQGKYLFGDFGTGKIWSLEETLPGQYLSIELLDTTLNIAAFAEDHDGELYLLNIFAGSIHKIAGDNSGQGGRIPAQLSGWGCFEPGDPAVFSANVIPYNINALLWSDFAAKERFIAIPDGTSIDVDSQGRFDFPVGSVLGKHFRLNGRLLETRLFLHHLAPHGWKGYSYEWDALETDATLLHAAKDKDMGGQIWHYPSPAECDACHTAAAGFTLGPEIGQLNRSLTYPATGLDANQLITLEQIGAFSLPLTDEQKSTVLYALDDTAYSPERRARSYLHANCANCHQPGGPGGGVLDLRMGTNFADMGLCNEPPKVGDLGLTNPVLLAPGDADQSILLLRMQSTGNSRMPPIATAIVDNQAAAVVRGWIDGLTGCP